MQVLWDVQSGKAICGSPTHTNFTLTLKFFHNRNDKLVTAGNYNLQVWEYDLPNNKLRPHEAQLGQLQRIFKSVCIDRSDTYAYCGTTTGDVLKVRGSRSTDRMPWPETPLTRARTHMHASMQACSVQTNPSPRSAHSHAYACMHACDLQTP